MATNKVKNIGVIVFGTTSTRQLITNRTTDLKKDEKGEFVMPTPEEIVDKSYGEFVNSLQSSIPIFLNTALLKPLWEYTRKNEGVLTFYGCDNLLRDVEGDFSVRTLRDPDTWNLNDIDILVCIGNPDDEDFEHPSDRLIAKYELIKKVGQTKKVIYVHQYAYPEIYTTAEDERFDLTSILPNLRIALDVNNLNTTKKYYDERFKECEFVNVNLYDILYKDFADLAVEKYNVKEITEVNGYKEIEDVRNFFSNVDINRSTDHSTVQRLRDLIEPLLNEYRGLVWGVCDRNKIDGKIFADPNGDNLTLNPTKYYTLDCIIHNLFTCAYYISLGDTHMCDMGMSDPCIKCALICGVPVLSTLDDKSIEGIEVCPDVKSLKSSLGRKETPKVTKLPEYKPFNTDKLLN